MHDFVVAFLGPLGTFTHQAAHETFGDSVEYRGCSTITAVFDAVASQSAHAGVIPQENSVFGSVIETYDALRREHPGFVQGEVVLEVRHCLLVPRGVKPSDVRRIKSHEQALGQCRAFLAQNFPAASLEKVTSTAAAAEAVLETRDSAAICSKICAVAFEGLEVLFESIQDRQDNRTRFYILTASQASRLPLPVPSPPSKALFRITPSPSERIVSLLTTLDLPVLRLDRRPQPQSLHPFQDVYFVEVERGNSINWVIDVEQAVQRLRLEQADVKLLGLW
ncbi:Prephenate dehydratase-domain-containing protein [Mycena amicta]|nr:Prephenate dehydratase-domain-containing protein [Mycena amicta]